MSEFGEAAGRLAAMVGRLTGWPPATFWQATPSEVALALGVVPAANSDALGREGLGALMAQFPDDKGTGDGR